MAASRRRLGGTDTRPGPSRPVAITGRRSGRSDRQPAGRFGGWGEPDRAEGTADRPGPRPDRPPEATARSA
jgi:hypothetical protein